MSIAELFAIGVPEDFFIGAVEVEVIVGDPDHGTIVRTVDSFGAHDHWYQY